MCANIAEKLSETKSKFLLFCETDSDRYEMDDQWRCRCILTWNGAWKELRRKKVIFEPQSNDKIQRNRTLETFNHSHYHLNLGMTNTPMWTRGFECCICFFSYLFKLNFVIMKDLDIMQIQFSFKIIRAW